LVFDKAETLNNTHHFESALVHHLLRLEELTERRVSPIFVSRTSFYYCLKGGEYNRDPIELHFPPYTESEMTDILNLYFAPTINDNIMDKNTNKDTLRSVVRLTVNTFWDRCRDFRELVYAISTLYPIFVERALCNEVKREEYRAPLAKAMSYIRQAYTCTYRRDMNNRSTSDYSSCNYHISLIDSINIAATMHDVNIDTREFFIALLYKNSSFLLATWHP